MKKHIITLLISAFFLCIIGIIMIYSSSSIWAEYKYNDSFYYLKLQSIFLFISVIALYIVSKINFKLYYKYANIILLISVILLILVLFPFIGVVRNGSRSWFKVGPLGFQPSELAKLCLIIFTCKYLSKNTLKIDNFKKSLLPILIIIFLVFFLIVLEPDFGSGMVLLLTIVIILFLSGLKISYFSYMGIFGITGIVFLIILAPYRLKRIISFVNPWSDPLGTGYQIIQSLYAIGPGGIFGLGLGNSIAKQFYLPEPQNDFIFSIICEETGLFGALLICFLFFLLFKSIVCISLKSKDLFGKYLSLSLGIIIILQAVLNMCVVVGLIPVTGVTLPFVSYGGSSLLISMINLGIIINIAKNDN